MQTPKGRSSLAGGAPQKTSPRAVSSEASRKNSPRSSSSEVTEKISPRIVRQLKSSPRYSEHTASSSNLATRASKERSPKIASEVNEQQKKYPSRVEELESLISQLESDLKIVKDQLHATEELKKEALKEAEESNQKLLDLSSKLEESGKQLLGKSSPAELSGEISEKRDDTVLYELKAIRKQHSLDSAALSCALDEIKMLKAQLEMVAESEATRSKNSESEQTELQTLNEKLSGTLLLVEGMKKQLKDAKESETRAHEVVGETLAQLETAKKMVDTLKSDELKASEAYHALVTELDQSKAHIGFLEELVSKLKCEIASAANKDSPDGDDDNAEPDTNGKIDIDSVKLEVEQLRSALEATELRYTEEQNRSAEQTKAASEMVERIKSEMDQREAKLELDLQKSKDEIDELKANLMDKETELQGICEENETLTVKIESTLLGPRELELEKELNKLKLDAENLRARLMEKELQWKKISDENEKLKLEIKDTSKGEELSDQVEPDIEAARAAESEALMKLGFLTEEIDKSNRKAVRAVEQLDAAQAANAEMEAELRRLKVQSDQWRKAAEAAAAMISAGNNGQLMERTGSMDSHYSPRMGKIGSPYADDLDEELMKKKNANMLRRFWKKPQK